MEQERPLSERAYMSIMEAEWRAALIWDLRGDASLVAVSFLEDWQDAARQAIEVCRLANRTLPQWERERVIERLEEFDPDRNLWEHYTLAEWFEA